MYVLLVCWGLCVLLWTCKCPSFAQPSKRFNVGYGGCLQSAGALMGLASVPLCQQLTELGACICKLFQVSNREGGPLVVSLTVPIAGMSAGYAFHFHMQRG